MRNNLLILLCFVLVILLFVICCGGGSNRSNSNAAIPNNEDSGQNIDGNDDSDDSDNEDSDLDPDNPSDRNYAVPQREISTADRNRLLGDGTEEIENEIEYVAAVGAAQSIRSLMSPVRDQGKRYSSSAFAAMALFEMTFPEGYDLSEQCLVYFSGGNDQTTVLEFVDNIFLNGIFNESSCPYSNDSSMIPAGLSLDDIDLLSSPGYTLHYGNPSITSLREVKNQLDRGLPMPMTLWVSSEDWYTGTGVIRHPKSKTDNLCAQSSTCGAHTIVFTGYDDIDKVMEFKNSWGTAWKNGGYGTLNYEYFLKNYVSGSDNQLFTVELGGDDVTPLR